MAINTKEFSAGDRVVTKNYGKGVVVSSEFVEKPSDGDHTFYRVRMENGAVRNLKAVELRGE
ncbi:hypothetical protein EPO14_01125 [Patescibacteria group bacterium]|nr:MAG: hypothetical protein EPO14_01125 [Patescibacteria group bacterium]